ncbi:MAG: DUF2306 domain-containing protein [Bacteroidota bacterium]
MWKLVKFPVIAVILFVGYLIFELSLSYYDPDFSRGYLIDKAAVFDGPFKYGLYAHIVSMPLLLLIGTAQVFFRYEGRAGAVHRVLGRVYGGMVLLVAAPSGLILAGYAFGGDWAKVSFYLLAVLWWLFTAAAWYCARKRDFRRHRDFMVRSYLLMISAVFLRLISFGMIAGLHWVGPEPYMWSAWLSWVPFLVGYEVVRLVRRRWYGS